MQDIVGCKIFRMWKARRMAGFSKKWMALIFELENKKFLTIWEL